MKSTTSDSRCPGREGDASLWAPCATDHTTSVSPASPFLALKIAKMNSLIAESPHGRIRSVQVSLIGDFDLNMYFSPIEGIEI